jgi:hypothetical protein
MQASEEVVMNRLRIATRFPFLAEAFLWTGAILTLYLLDPATPGRVDLCLFHRLGLEFCPGCGLGASIHHLLHGDLVGSWRLHPLGVPALLLIGARAFTLWRRSIATALREIRAEGESRCRTY